MELKPGDLFRYNKKGVCMWLGEWPDESDAKAGDKWFIEILPEDSALSGRSCIGQYWQHPNWDYVEPLNINLPEVLKELVDDRD